MRSATADDIDAVVETLSLAFATDPVWGDWAFPLVDPADRVHLHLSFWETAVRAAVRYDGIRMTPNAEAVAVWVPPGVAELNAEEEAAAAEAVLRVCGRQGPAVLEAFARFEAAMPSESEHWYLSLLATHPDHRGHGLGMRLVGETLAECDAAGIPAYLESTNPVNLDRYRRAGFEVFGGFEVPDGPRVDQMWREPAGNH
jgi:GNAT superfamily N-acetyltransferase